MPSKYTRIEVSVEDLAVNCCTLFDENRICIVLYNFGHTIYIEPCPCSAWHSTGLSHRPGVLYNVLASIAETRDHNP